MDEIFVVIHRETVAISVEVVAEEAVIVVEVVIVVEDTRVMVDMICLKRETPGTNNLCLWNSSCSSF